MWSLGVLLYELCALCPPFDAGNIAALIMKIANFDSKMLETFPNQEHYSIDL